MSLNRPENSRRTGDVFRRSVPFRSFLAWFYVAENAAGQYGGNGLQTLIGCHVIRISDVSHVRTVSWERA